MCLIAMAVCPVPDLRAQDTSATGWQYKGEVFGSAGWGRFFHGDNNLGSGLDLGGGIGIRPFSGSLRGLGFEVLLNGLNFSNAWGDGYSYDGTMRAVTGNVVYHLSRSRTQPYLVGGLGILRADYTYINGYVGNVLDYPDYRWDYRGNKMTINLGVGVKARVTQHLSIRPEFRMFDTTIGKGYNWLSVRLSIGLGYHF
jgi:hypothetical protein